MIFRTTRIKDAKRNFQILPRVTNCLLLAAFLFLIASCGDKIPEVSTFSKEEILPSIEAEGFDMLISDSTVIRYKLQAPKLIRHDDIKEPFTEFPKGVRIEKYDAKMKVISIITALYAKNFANDDRWEAKNNVVAVNLNGDTLKTEYLVWDTKKEKIYSDQFVRIIRANNNLNLTGTGITANLDFTDYLFYKPIGGWDFEVDK